MGKKAEPSLSSSPATTLQNLVYVRCTICMNVFLCIAFVILVIYVPSLYANYVVPEL